MISPVCLFPQTWVSVMVFLEFQSRKFQSGKIPWRGRWQPAPLFLPGESYGRRSLAGYCPWGCKESDMTEWLAHTLIGCITLSANSWVSHRCFTITHDTVNFPLSIYLFGFSLVVMCGLSSCSSQSYLSASCEISVLRPGIKPTPLAREAGFLTTGPPWNAVICLCKVHGAQIWDLEIAFWASRCSRAPGENMG